MDGDRPMQESNIDEGESKPEDSSFQEQKPPEDEEPVQAAESDKPVEQVQSQPGENAGNTQETTMDNATSENNDHNKCPTLQEGEQSDIGGDSEKKQDADEQQVVAASEEKQSETTLAGEAQEADARGTNNIRDDNEPQKDGDKNKNMRPGEEQQDGVPAVTEEMQEGDGKSTSNTGDESEQQKDENKDVTASEKQRSEVPVVAGEAQGGDGTSHTERQEHDAPTQNNQQVVVALSQEQQYSPAQVEEGAEKPVESGNTETTEEERNKATVEADETSQADGVGTSESCPKEDSPNGETQPPSGEQEGSAKETVMEMDEEVQKPDTFQQNGSTQEIEAIEGKETAMERQQPVEPEAIAHHKPDQLQEENRKLKQMMKQQEDAYRIKVLSLEQEVGKLRARKIDNRSQGEY